MYDFDFIFSIRLTNHFYSNFCNPFICLCATINIIFWNWYFFWIFTNPVQWTQLIRQDRIQRFCLRNIYWNLFCDFQISAIRVSIHLQWLTRNFCFWNMAWILQSWIIFHLPLYYHQILALLSFPNTLSPCRAFAISVVHFRLSW